MLFTTDHVGSDDVCPLQSLTLLRCLHTNQSVQMEAVLEFSAREAAAAPHSNASSSRKVINGKDKYLKHQELVREISRLEAELTDIDDQIAKLRELRTQVV